MVDLDALAAALRAANCAARRSTCFPHEPASNEEQFVSPLQGLDNVILTPHVGGSTEEAQERIGEEVARKLIDYCDTGATIGAVNFPQVQLPARPLGTRFIQVQRNLPGMLGKLNEVFARHHQHRRAILRDRATISATSCSTPTAPPMTASGCSPTSARSREPFAPGCCMSGRGEERCHSRENRNPVCYAIFPVSEATQLWIPFAGMTR